MMPTLKFVFDKYAGLTKMYNADTGEAFLGATGVILTMTPGHCEAAIITDEPLLEGELEIPIKEQMVISEGFMSLLVDQIKREISRDIEELTNWHNRIASHDLAASDIGPATIDGIAQRVVEYMDARQISRVITDDFKDLLIQSVNKHFAEESVS